jgi:esterase/lipase superfamily enzyme
MTKRVFLALVLLLAACTGRNPVIVFPQVGANTDIQQVFVATLRNKDPRTLFGSKRVHQMQYLKVAVSVPPNRKLGEIRSGRKHPDPTRDFVIAGVQNLAGQHGFQTNLRQNLARRKGNDREVTIFVHGYNNSFTDGVFRSAQMLHDFKLPGPMVHFSWPSSAHPLGYAYDRDSVLFARDGLEQLLRDVRAAGPRRVLLVGHSLGTMLIMETLRQIEIRSPGWAKKNLSGVVLISPDIDLDLFQIQTSRFHPLPQPFAIFASKNDRALRVSTLINGSQARLGTVTNPKMVANLPVLLFDVTKFSHGAGTRHFTPGTSPALIKLLSRSVELNRTFSTDKAGQPGFFPGTVIRVKKATQLILSPGVVVQ